MEPAPPALAAADIEKGLDGRSRTTVPQSVSYLITDVDRKRKLITLGLYGPVRDACVDELVKAGDQDRAAKRTHDARVPLEA